MSKKNRREDEKEKSGMRVKYMLRDIRLVISDYRDIPEKEMYSALVSESDWWDMRLEEIENEEEEEDS